MYKLIRYLQLQALWMHQTVPNAIWVVIVILIAIAIFK